MAVLLTDQWLISVDCCLTVLQAWCLEHLYAEPNTGGLLASDLLAIGSLNYLSESRG